MIAEKTLGFMKGKRGLIMGVANDRSLAWGIADRRSPGRRLSVTSTDAAAMTPVRLSRLPGCMRHGATGENGTYFKYDQPRLQELLYLNPGAVHGVPILTMPARQPRKAARS